MQTCFQISVWCTCEVAVNINQVWFFLRTETQLLLKHNHLLVLYCQLKNSGICTVIVKLKVSLGRLTFVDMSDQVVNCKGNISRIESFIFGIMLEKVCRSATK